MSSAAVLERIRVRPTRAALGADIEDVDLGRPLDDAIWHAAPPGGCHAAGGPGLARRDQGERLLIERPAFQKVA
jgi:hypothetical protein